MSASVTSIQTTITCPDVAGDNGWPLSFPFTLAIDYGTVGVELVDVTSKGGFVGSVRTWNVTRGVDFTAQSGHSSGATVRHVIAARDLRQQSNSDATPQPLGVAAQGTSDVASRDDHVHSDTIKHPTLGDTVLGASSMRVVGWVFGVAPTGGPYLSYDIALDYKLGGYWECTSGGSPGTWAYCGMVIGTATPQPLGTASAGTTALGTGAAAVDHVHSNAMSDIQVGGGVLHGTNYLQVHRASSVQSLGAGAWTDVAFNFVDTNVQDDGTIYASPYFTAKVAGMIVGMVTLSFSALGQKYIRWVTSGGVIMSQIDSAAGGTVSCPVMLAANAGTQIKVQVNSVGACNIDVHAATTPSLAEFAVLS